MGGVLIPFPRKLFFSNPSSNPTIPACVAQIEIPFPFFYCFFSRESQSQCTKSHFPASKKGKSQLPFYPFTTLFLARRVFLVLALYTFALYRLKGEASFVKPTEFIRIESVMATHFQSYRSYFDLVFSLHTPLVTLD